MDARKRFALPIWHIPALVILLILVSYSLLSRSPLLPGNRLAEAPATTTAQSTASPEPPARRAPLLSAGPVATTPPAEPTPTPPAEPTPTPPAEPTPTPSAEPTSAPAATATPTLMPQQARRELFEEVWQTVKANYLYEDFQGIDWEALRATYEPRAVEAGSAEEFYAALSAMVEALGDEHSRYLSPWEAAEEKALTSGGDGYVGIGIMSERREDAILVRYVFPGSPAQGAGIRRRDRILAVDGVPVARDPEIRGPEGTWVSLTVRSPEEDARQLDVERRRIATHFEAVGSRLGQEGSIGYLLIPSLWAEDMDTQVEQRLSELLAGGALEGLIIDLRGNGGGWRPVLIGILGQLASGEVGSFFTQSNSYALDIQRGALFDALKDTRVVVLIDGATESYAEVLAAVLQARGRAQIVGVASAGNTETIYGYTFDDASRLWVAQEGFRLSDGTDLEGRGVMPDMRVGQDWTIYPAERDPYLLAALKLLQR